MTSTVTTRADADRVAEQVCAGLTDLLDAEFWKFSGDDLLDTARSVERVARLTFAVQVAVAGEIDLARLAQTHGQTGTAALLRQALSIGPGDARNRVRAARQVLPQDAISGGEIPPQLPELGEALRAGAVGAEQTSVVVKTISRIPADVPVQVREQAQSTLVGHARVMDPLHLGLVAEKLICTLDPDGDFEPRDPADRAELALGVRDARTGLTGIKGRLDDHAVAVFIAATDAHAKPRPEADGIKDPRSANTRLAQALTTVLEDYLTTGQGPVQGGERPHVTMTVGWDAITGQLGAAVLDATGITVAPATARRVLCDCDVIPAVLGSNGEPLDIGRATRTWPTGIRRAVALRDGGCVFPGCDRPARWSEIHHIWHWVDGGPTSLVNGACLCSAITPLSIRETGRSGWPKTATPRSSHPPGSTPTNAPAATTCIGSGCDLGPVGAQVTLVTPAGRHARPAGNRVAGYPSIGPPGRPGNGRHNEPRRRSRGSWMRDSVPAWRCRSSPRVAAAPRVPAARRAPAGHPRARTRLMTYNGGDNDIMRRHVDIPRRGVRAWVTAASTPSNDVASSRHTEPTSMAASADSMRGSGSWPGSGVAAATTRNEPASGSPNDWAACHSSPEVADPPRTTSTRRSVRARRCATIRAPFRGSRPRPRRCTARAARTIARPWRPGRPRRPRPSLA